MANALYTSDNYVSPVTFAHSKRTALLQQVNAEGRDLSADDLDTLDVFGETIAFTKASNQSDATIQLAYAVECLDLYDHDINPVASLAKFNAATQSALAFMQAG